jgi:hypothetical protein
MTLMILCCQENNSSLPLLNLNQLHTIFCLSRLARQKWVLDLMTPVYQNKETFTAVLPK